MSDNTNSNTADEDNYTKISEGQATILFPKENEVFYNPVQQFNRDMSIAAIRTWDAIRRREQAAKQHKHRAYKEMKGEPVANGKSPETTAQQTGFTILEALSASGLRSIRYAKEVPNVRQIVANDLEAEAVESIKRNVAFNKIPDGLIVPNQGEACNVMYEHREYSKRFDVVDIDPYGSASMFIDGAIQSVSNGGLLCVTCTDMAVMSGTNYTETCFAKYGGMPLKLDSCHEMGLRLVLNTLQNSAARYKRYIVPLASCSIDFYIRLFVRVYDSPAEVKKTASKLSMVYLCRGCKSFSTNAIGKITETDKGKKYAPNGGPPVDKECEHCGNGFQIGGPVWNSAIHEKSFVKEMLEHVKTSEGAYQTKARMEGMLTVISEEIDTPLYYTLNGLSSILHCTSPSMLAVFSAICNGGYNVTISHAMPGSLKTDAPNSVIWDIFRAWVKNHPVTQKNISPKSPALKILAKEPSFVADFTPNPKADPTSRKVRLCRFQENPEKNWGPKPIP